MDRSSPDKALPFTARRSEREDQLSALRAGNERSLKAGAVRSSCRIHADECLVECRIEHPGGGVANWEMLVSDISASAVCNTLHATGAGYGFAVLSDTANNAVTALNASCSAKESAADLRKILHMVERIVPPG